MLVQGWIQDFRKGVGGTHRRGVRPTIKYEACLEPNKVTK